MTCLTREGTAYVLEVDKQSLLVLLQREYETIPVQVRSDEILAPITRNPACLSKPADPLGSEMVPAAPSTRCQGSTLSVSRSTLPTSLARPGSPAKSATWP
ncbi:UNVERIFIED_CONTAM: hypothetical protein K2H54_000017 [Gekko kuhli]